MKRLLLAVGLVVGLVLSMAQPASATESGWQTISPNERWTCSGRLSSPSSIADVRACIVISGNYAQAVLSVRNVSLNRIEITAPPGVYLMEDGAERWVSDCTRIEIYTDWRRGCLTPSFNSPCGDYVQAKIRVLVRTIGGRDSLVTGFSPTKRYCSS